ncbi:hypothetical protein JGU66_12440 [Myxococcaceae bacterium JPH2]|nr:hypothetical protein [Myxococcaceae bacterium JPH2]
MLDTKTLRSDALGNSLAEAFLAWQGEAWRIWPFTARGEAHHFLFEADPARLGALIAATRAFEATGEASLLLDFFMHERPGFERALDAVRTRPAPDALEQILSEDREARATWLGVGEDGVRAHRYHQLVHGLLRVRQLEELSPPPAILQFSAETLHRLVREPPDVAALLHATRERTENGDVHALFMLCLQTALLPESPNLGLGCCPSRELDETPCALPRTLIAPSDDAEHTFSLLSDGFLLHIGDITWGSGAELQRAALDGAGLAEALGRLGAQGAPALSFMARLDHDPDDLDSE